MPCNHIICAVRFCKSSSGQCFHRFPKDQNRRNQWIKFCGAEYLYRKGNLYNSYYRVCRAHFETEMYKTTHGKTLHVHAIPTLNRNVFTDDNKKDLILPTSMVPKPISDTQEEFKNVLTEKRFEEGIERKIKEEKVTNFKPSLNKTCTRDYSLRYKGKLIKKSVLQKRQQVAALYKSRKRLRDVEESPDDENINFKIKTEPIDTVEFQLEDLHHSIDIKEES